MKDAGVSDNFAFSVAHSIHSLSVRELRKFKPDVTEDNHIPTINEDLNADLPILLYAPDRKGPNDAAFMTDGMKTLDEVLDHLGDSAYGIRFSNPLEMIEHAFHMKELWHMVHHAYVDLEKSPPDSRVCGCVKDIENNGLLDALRTIAMIFREPYLVYGNRLKDYETKTERGNPAVNKFGYNKENIAVNKFGYNAESPAINKFGYNAESPAINKFGYNAESPAVNKFGYNAESPAINKFGYKAESPAVNKFGYNAESPAINKFGYNAESPAVNKFGYNAESPAVNKFGYNAESPAVNKFGYNADSPAVNKFGYNAESPAVNKFGYNAESPAVNKFGYNAESPAINNEPKHDESESKPSASVGRSKRSVDHVLKTRDQAVPHLVDRSSWQATLEYEIAGMAKHTPQDAALFLYCSLNNV